MSTDGSTHSVTLKTVAAHLYDNAPEVVNDLSARDAFILGFLRGHEFALDQMESLEIEDL